MSQANQLDNEILFDNIGFLIGKSAQIKDRLFDQYLAVEDITSSQIKVLFNLYYMGQQHPSDIGKALNVDNSSITRMIDRLVKKDFIQRIPDQKDKRSILIDLTERGYTVTTRAIPLANEAINKLTECLTKHEKHYLQQCLGKIVDAFLPEESRMYKIDTFSPKKPR